MRKLDPSFVIYLYKESGCELLDEYINSRIKMRYICSCGLSCQSTFNSFKAGRRCKKCGIVKSKNKQKLSFEYVKNFYLRYGCELLETEYINNTVSMKYKCKCGRISRNGFGNFQKQKKCRLCANKLITLGLKLVNCLDNIQPLKDEDNLKKGDRYDKLDFLKWIGEKCKN